jgi:hypothetical protein
MLVFIGLSIYGITILPAVSIVHRTISFLQILLFMIYLSFYLDLKRVLAMSLPRLNLFRFISGCLLASFVVSFYVNWDSNHGFTAIARVITYPIIFIVFFYIFPKKILLNEELAEKFLDYLLLFGVASSLLALLIFFSGARLSQYYMTTANFYRNPNAFGMWFVMFIPVAFYKYFTKQLSLILLGLFLTILSVCLLLTYSRSAYIVVSIAILIVIFHKSKPLFLATLVIFAFLILTVLVDFATAKTGYTLFSRSLLFMTAFDMIFYRGTHHFLWGYGAVHGIEVFNRDKDLFGTIDLVPEAIDPHNFLLLLGISYGSMVTILFLSMILFIVFRTILMRKRKIPAMMRGRINLFLAIVIGIFIQNMTEDVLAYPEYFLMPLFLIFLGYLYQIGEMVKATAKD